MEDQLVEIRKELEAIRQTIQRLPEVNAAVFFQFYEEFCAARLTGKKVSDLWEITPPNLP